MSRPTREHCRRSLLAFRLRGFHPLWPTFPGSSARLEICNSATLTPVGSGNVPRPRCGNGRRLLRRSRFRLFPVRSPLLRESRLISFPPGTEMVQFPGFASHPLCIQGVISLDGMGFPIRKPPDLRLLPPPRGVSPVAASFIAWWRLGIHRAPLVS